MSTEAFVDATGLRLQRAQAARWLAQQTTRSDLAWHELAEVPAWAWADSSHREALALHVGAWCHADTLRRCIDGSTRQALRSTLGEDAFDALMSADIAADAPRLPADWRLWLPDEGRRCLLASIERPRLRLALHRALWPALMDVPPPGLRPADAWALVHRAAARLTPDPALQEGAAP